MSTCPPDELLTRLGSDALTTETYAGLEDHIESCDACQAFLQRLVDQGPGTATNATRRMPARGTIPDIPDLAIERELGRGSMGVVYLARQESLQRRVALKILRDGPGTGTRERGRWRREARAAARAPHPNAVQVFQVGESEAGLYLVFEYVAGGTLKERLEEPLPPAVAARLLEEIARAVGHFHGAGVLHLDLKPSNILLDGPHDAGWERVTPKVADFGISRLGNEPRATTGSRVGPLGTPDYMAPEQAAADRDSLGPACDLYALGAILYHALTGRPPFQAASVVETLDQVRGQEPVPPRRLNPCIPRDLDTICLKCLQKDPRRRYESAEALADDLRRWRAGEPITARPESPFEHIWRYCRRRPAIATLAAALILTLATSLVGLVVLLKRAQAERARAVAGWRTAVKNEQTAMATMRQLNLLATTAVGGPSPLLSERIIETTRVLRDRIGELKARPRFDRQLLGGLGIFERVLAEKLHQEGKQNEARALLAESVGLLQESRAQYPTEQFLLQQHIGSLIALATSFPLPAQGDQALESLDKAEALLPILASKDLRIINFSTLSDLRRQFAEQFGVSGDPGRFRRLLGADLRMFKNLDARDRNHPQLVICNARSLARVGQFARARELLRASLENDSLDPGSREQLQGALAGLAGCRFPYLVPAGAEFFSSRPDDADEAWADALLAEVQARCRRFGIDPAVTPEVIWGMAESAATVASQQRRSGRLAEARRTSERIGALADRLVALHPEEPAAYMMLTAALIQQSKTAWKDNDRAIVERAERQALVAARRALAFDPVRQDARRVVDQCEHRVARLQGR